MIRSFLMALATLDNYSPGRKSNDCAYKQGHSNYPQSLACQFKQQRTTSYLAQHYFRGKIDQTIEG
jgi:hypothetical protein